MKRRFMKLTALFSAVLVGTSMLAGCGSKENTRYEQETATVEVAEANAQGTI